MTLSRKERLTENAPRCRAKTLSIILQAFFSLYQVTVTMQFLGGWCSRLLNQTQESGTLQVRR